MGQVGNPRLELDDEQVVERALGALDLRAQHGLTPHVHGDELARVREVADLTVQTPDRLVGS
jgi:hypothetical protein